MLHKGNFPGGVGQRGLPLGGESLNNGLRNKRLPSARGAPTAARAEHGATHHVAAGEAFRRSQQDETPAHRPGPQASSSSRRTSSSSHRSSAEASSASASASALEALSKAAASRRYSPGSERLSRSLAISARSFSMRSGSSRKACCSLKLSLRLA